MATLKRFWLYNQSLQSAVPNKRSHLFLLDFFDFSHQLPEVTPTRLLIFWIDLSRQRKSLRLRLDDLKKRKKKPQMITAEMTLLFILSCIQKLNPSANNYLFKKFLDTSLPGFHLVAAIFCLSTFVY